MQRAYDWEEDYWENKPSIKTALNKTNMDKLSNATRIIDERVITLDLTKLSTTEANGMITGITINQDNGDITVTYYSGATKVLHTCGTDCHQPSAMIPGYRAAYYLLKRWNRTVHRYVCTHHAV